MCYIYIQSSTERKQHSTDKDTTSKLKYNKSLTVKKTNKKPPVIFNSVYKHANHTANVVQCTHRGLNLVLLKGGDEKMCFQLRFKRRQGRTQADFQR